MDYSHHRKAGNQGDVVKHPALVAAVSTVLDDSDALHYADAFAGHAWHPLLDEKLLEWPNGIGNLTARNSSNTHVRFWIDEFIGAGKLLGREYPGSAVIAQRIGSHAGKPVKLDLCELQDEPYQSLVKQFHGCDGKVHRAAVVDEQVRWPESFQRVLENSDFLFLDPPGLYNRDKEKTHLFPRWSFMKSILRCRGDRPTMLWLPTTGLSDVWNNWISKGDGSKRARDAQPLGYATTSVRWNTGRSKAGCDIVYNVAYKEVSAAISAVVELTDWASKAQETAESTDTSAVVFTVNAKS